MSAPNGQVQIDVQDMVSALQSLHAQQLGSANLEAARWQAIAAQQRRQIAELTKDAPAPPP